jgi:hypothetical protein
MKRMQAAAKGRLVLLGTYWFSMRRNYSVNSERTAEMIQHSATGFLGNPLVHSLLVTLGNHAVHSSRTYNGLVRKAILKM